MEELQPGIEPAEFERAANAVDVGLLLLELFGNADATESMVNLVLDRRPDLGCDLWIEVKKFVDECADEEGSRRQFSP